MIQKIKTIFEGRGTSANLMLRKSLPALSPHPQYLPAVKLARMLGYSTNAIYNWKLNFKKENVELFKFNHGSGKRVVKVKVFSVKEAVAHAKEMGRRRIGKGEKNGRRSCH